MGDKSKDYSEHQKASDNLKKIAKENQFMTQDSKKKLRAALLRLWKSSQ